MVTVNVEEEDHRCIGLIKYHRCLELRCPQLGITRSGGPLLTRKNGMGVNGALNKEDGRAILGNEAAKKED